MRKRYKIKKRHKALNSYIIFIVFFIFALLISSAYALLSDSLKVNGKANILINTEEGASTYSWELLESWPGTEGTFYYQIEIYVLNRDGDHNSWEVKFDLPDGFLISSNLWQASSVTLKGNTVTLTSHEWNSYIADGSTFTLNLILGFESPIDFTLSNLILNGKAVKYQPTS